MRFITTLLRGSLALAALVAAIPIAKTIKPQLSITWPKNGDVAQILYCFRNEKSAEELAPIMDQAVAKWTTALGDHAAVKFIDIDAPGTPDEDREYCQFEYDKEWNNVIPADTLVIKYEENKGGYFAEAGYKPPVGDDLWDKGSAIALLDQLQFRDVQDP
ncbi:hypothetical protein EJ08DRAFT_666840 [Tothia fuscella]|uniref:Uncharacterized protein n=1 Tax=Tothia fuscella TaxID=1048955 RepID=A0A9P4NDW7_9PEZI|nr:hypothetical protein EJ08DRAFT_666840 [Tothia fuscella]